MSVVLFAALTLSTRSVRADEPSPLHLDVQSTALARACGDTEVVRSKIAERLGRDPFVDGPASGSGARTLEVRFSRVAAAPRRWVADITLLDPQGKKVGTRALSESTSTCDPLVTSVVFTMAVLLEDLAAAAQTSPQAPPQAQPAASTRPAWEDSASRPDFNAPPPPAPSPSNSRIRPDVSVAAFGAVAIAPSPALGAEVDLGFNVERWRLELGGRTTFPSSDADTSIGVRTRIAAGRVAPCYGVALVSGCLVVSVGSISGEAIGKDVARSRLESQLYASGGVGLLSRIFVGDVFIRGSFELSMAFARTGFDVGAERIWTLPAVSAAGTLGAGVRLP